MTILDEINNNKLFEIAASKKRISIDELSASPLFNRKANSLARALGANGASGIIAEFKTKSPSKGMINGKAEIVQVTTGYAKAGVSGLSVLTDHPYFGGSLEDLKKARQANPLIPILRKDFMLDPYQIYEAKSHGADLILLIAASLSKGQMEDLAGTARELGLEVLAEIHTEEEIEKLNPMIDLIGVNNRNLKTFEVDVETSVRLSKLLPGQAIRISESGLSSVENIQYLKNAGFQGFLMGENFMKTDHPDQACADFIKKITTNNK